MSYDEAAPTEPAEGLAYSLYRHFAADGTLLYVGISVCPISRTYLHRGNSLWFAEVATITIERFASRAEAMEAERQALNRENPKYNIRRASLGRQPFEKSPAKMVFYLPDDLDDQLRDLASDCGQSLSMLVTRLLQSELGKAEKTAR
jgi:hypothetical protein